MTIYVITSHRHGSHVRSATTDETKVAELCEEAEQHYHKCYGLKPCTPNLFWERTGSYSPHVKVTQYQDGVPG